MATNPPTQQGSYSSSDRNGNEITATNGVYTDTLNTTALTVVAGSSNVSLFYAAPSGQATYAVSTKSYTVRTNFGCNGVTEYNTARTIQNNLVDRVTLPDGSYYQFYYETTYQDTHAPHDVTARIASVTLPTGGTISYVYATGGTGVNGISCSDGTATTVVRTTPDTGSNSWTYARTQVGGAGTHWQTTITDPTSNQTVIDFQKDSGTATSSYYYETQRQVYQGLTSGTLLDTVTTCYNTNTASCTTTSVAGPVYQKNVTTQFGTGGLKGLQVSSYDLLGDLLEQDNYDYASGTPTTILNKTLITYASLMNGIVTLPATVTVCSGTGTSSSCGGTGTVAAQTTYTYDQGTRTTTSGTPQFDGLAGARGNATTIARLVQGSTTLNQTYTYFDTGMVNTSTDVNGAVTTYNYPNASSTCGNTFPTSVNLPITSPSLTRSYTWNCGGGVQTQVTDENGKSTTTSYADAYFWRPSSVTDASNAVTNVCYGLMSGGSCVTDANQVEVYLNFNSGNSTVDKLTTSDGLGRAHIRQTRQAPGSPNFDSVETDYNSLGQLSRTTLPYTGTAGQTSSSAPGTLITYDAISRIKTYTDSGNGSTTYTYNQNDVNATAGPAPIGENAKSRLMEYNGLSQLSSVCEVTTVSPSGTCGQNTAATGYLTKYSYDPLGNLTGVTQNAQPNGTAQIRSYSYDGVNRMISETNPEIGPSTGPAPITYTYDTATGCSGTFAGALVKRADPVGNSACFGYDALHRRTSVTYSGPYAGVTPNKYFVYDSATVNGVVLANVKNRTAEAYTATSPSGTKITDEGFSYTARGEVSDVYQLTPHSSPAYYHVSQSYWPHGSPSTLSSDIGGVLITGLPAISYGGTIGSTVGLDGEARTTQVTASGTGQQNPVTAVSYNVASLPTQVTLGSGDSDVFAYDPYTFRMNQYQFNVNGQPSKGQLTWNANSTLQKLVITDAYNSADNQTCNYSYDDVTRLVGANCGTAAAQTFSYDPFGNIYKSGSPYAFKPTYSASTNRMTSLPGNFTPSYDNNGNVTNDSNHTYSWDADGNSVSIDTVGLTFDALHRMVEKQISSTYTEIIYAPNGVKFAVMGGTNGQTLQNAFVPLPGQATAVYTSGGLDHYRHSDWLGSARLTSSSTHTFLSSLAYAPFGESYAQTGTADMSFTGQNQDTANGDYDFLSREYSNEGRWPAPDPAGLKATKLAYPQSWNRYAYVLNNPLGLVDPLGLWCVWGDGTHDDDPSNGGATSGQCADQGGFWDSTDTVIGAYEDHNSDWVAFQTSSGSVYAGCSGTDCSQSQLDAFAVPLLNALSSQMLGNYISDLWSNFTHPSKDTCKKVDLDQALSEGTAVVAGGAAFFAPVTTPVSVPVTIFEGGNAFVDHMYIHFFCGP